jgi:serine phosphatase RsbU (regulator of sigma subunit)/anti-sigma regulatory factor (Ser/Thr protein kinase)
MMVAKNGEQALKAASSATPPDLILLDIMMPEMDGYEVCRRLKAAENTRAIPVIFVTAMTDDTDEAKGLEVGGVDYLTKPISPAIVQARVKTQLALKAHLEELQAAYSIIESQRNRMQKELNVGRDIQLSMVPTDFPQRPEFVISATLEPALEVGGDFYDCFFIDEEHLCFSVGDVSDKGVASALFMAMTKTMLKSRAKSDLSTASIVTHANDELSVNNDACMFVTLYLGILNLSTGELLSTNAGHNPPLIKRADGSVEWLERRDGPVVGAMDGMSFKEGSVKLSAGDELLLYTDGVTEAKNEQNELFSDDRLFQLFTESAAMTAEERIDVVKKAVYAFEGNAPRADDITVMTIQLTDALNKKDRQVFRGAMINEVSAIPGLQSRLEDHAQDWPGTEVVMPTVMMALDELLSNVVKYAFPDDSEDHQIEVRAEVVGDSLIMSVTDDGISFNPFTQEEPDTSLSIEEREIGGLGIHLVKRIFDETSYQRKVNQNVVTLVKHLRKAE